jgi:hypothetical protein
VTESLPWTSSWKPAFDEIVESAPSPSGAVDSMTQFAKREHLDLPTIYGSTAITSAGHKRDPELQGADAFPEVIRRNNRTASLLKGSLCDHTANHVSSVNTMVPTELGKVTGWKDTHYLQFYFAWLAGLSPSGAVLYAEGLTDPAYEKILAAADDRSLPNEARWPAYKIFVEIAIAKLADVERRTGAKHDDGATILLQLNDVGESLGCRAEQMYSDARGLDVIAPSIAADIGGDLGDDLAHLADIGAQVGVVRGPVELVAVGLH